MRAVVVGRKKRGSEFVLDKWQSFIARWARALAAYGTPMDFIEGSETPLHEYSFDGELWPFYVPRSPNNALRRELSSKQKKYVPKMEPSEYGLRHMDLEGCFLCENIVQGIDAQRFPGEVLDNIVFDCGEYVIASNRYPGMTGHSLFIIKEHDDLTRRVEPIVNGGQKRYPITPGKTRGSIVTPEYLEAMARASDKHHLFALRNHTLEGMSLAVHDHFHLFPEDLKACSLVKFMKKQGKEDTGLGEGIYRPENTPFDTLVMDRSKIKDFYEVAAELLKRMEEDNQVFVLNYHAGFLLVSPRVNMPDSRVQVGAGVCSHWLPYEQEARRNIVKHVPMKSQYNWSMYF